jgi:hypothetical protein
MQRRPEVTHAVKAERQVLPDCMMPDGGEPCRGFYAVYRQLEEYRKALTIAEQNLSREHAENARLKAGLADARHDLESLISG